MDRQEAERLLAEHAKARDALLDEIIAEVSATERTLWQIGSFAQGRADAWSDLDLLVAGGPCPIGEPALTLVNPANGPVGGGHTGAAYLTGPLLVWVDWYAWPAGLPAPAEARLLAGRGPQSELPLAETLDRYGRGASPTRFDQDGFALAMMPIAAKYVARGNADAVAGMLTMLGAGTGPDPADSLRALLQTTSGPAPLVERIANTIDVAEALSR